MHTHCEYSPDSRTPVAVQALAIKAAGLDVVCATDHNTIEGALRLRELADGFRVIVGEEVSSREGEIIGLFLEKPIPRGLSAEDTIAQIHDQGGLVSVPHPYSHNRLYRIRRDALERVGRPSTRSRCSTRVRRSPATTTGRSRSRRPTRSPERSGATRTGPGRSVAPTSRSRTSPAATISSHR
jgi:Predicted metal-dependent phosphoesterases (PHP family)